MWQEQPAGGRRVLGEGGRPVRAGHSGSVDKERDRIHGVRAPDNGREVIAGDDDGRVRVAQGVEHGRDDALVEELDGLAFEVGIAHVAAFVRRFHVHVDKIAACQKFQGGLNLAFVIGVDEAVGAGHVRHLHVGGASQPLDQINGRDHGAAQSPPLVEVRQVQWAALAPGPDRGGRRRGFIGQKGVGPTDKGVHLRKAGKGAQVLVDALVQDVVGRSDGQAGRWCGGPVFLHEQVAILDAGNGREDSVLGDFGQPGHEWRGGLGGDMPGGIVPHDARGRQLRDRDQIHAPD